ncbi:hypothetical protein DICPUDRAFT_155584, partial [Dictyostelium purpureum]
YLGGSPFSIVGSIYDIALYFFGQEDSCQQLLNLNFFKYLNILFCYSVMVAKGHSKIEYSPSDGLYYLNKLSTNNNDNNNNDNLINYSKITIGSIKYNILEILNLNHQKDNDLYYDYKTMILLLETTDTNEKIYCIRKQKKEHLTEKTIDEVKFEEIDNNKFKEFNDQIIVPCYIVQDINTSYYFFKSELKIKSIEDIIEKDYNDISIIRSLLYYFEYFVSNPSNSNQVILIKSKSVLDQQTEDFLIILDISYFIRRVYGFYIESSIRGTKEMYLTGGNFEAIQLFGKLYTTNFFNLKEKMKMIKHMNSNFEMDILEYKFNSELLILNIIKEMEGVVQIYDYYLDDDLIYILIEYCENTTNLSEFKIKDPSQITQILKQMVNILEKLEEHDIYHRDIKNENILIQENNGEIQCILSDFGTSGIGSELKKDEEKYYSRNGSRNYQPHEIYIKKLRSKNPIESLQNKHDIFSLGCVIKSLFEENKLKAGEEINTIIKKMTQLQKT